MRYVRRIARKSTFGILLIRLDDVVRTFLVGFDGYNFLCFQDTRGMLDYELLRKVYKVCPSDGEFYEIDNVFCQRYNQEFFAFTQVIQQIDFVDFSLSAIGAGIYSVIRNAIDDADFPYVAAMDVMEFVNTCECIGNARYRIASGGYVALTSKQVFGV